MLKKSKENGITLTSLVIAVIIIAALVGVSLSMGNASIDTTKDADRQGALDIVQEAVLTQYTKATSLKQLQIRPNGSFSNKPSVFVGQPIKDTAIDTSGMTRRISWVMLNANYDGNVNDDYRYYEDYYYRLKENDLATLGITNTNTTYVVNYRTGEVFDETKKTTSTGEVLYITSLDTVVTTSNNTVDNTFAQ